MKNQIRASGIWVASFAAVALTAMFATPVFAHCDGLDGPVVMAAQEALDKGDVNLVLVWVKRQDEPEVRKAFERTATVRKLSPPARELADTYFFETLVRIHRVGEGASYTGLKPAGRDLGPAIPAADTALRSGDAAPLINLLVDDMRHGLIESYQQAIAARNYQSGDIDAGRAYVEKYVAFIHYVERVYEASIHPAEGHYPEVVGSPSKEQ